MMQRFLVFIVFMCLFINAVFSQTWCENGATWHYNYAVWQTKDVIDVKYIKDTLIGATTCKVLQKKLNYYNLASETFHTKYLGNEYLYENNSVVYRYNLAQFDTLFDFNANTGDSWKISGSNEFGATCDSTGYLKVDSIGTTVINSITLKYICVSPKTGSNWGMVAKVVEKIGPIKNFNSNYISYLFPIKTDNCGVLVVDAYEEKGSFRCYSDNNFQYNLLDAQTPTCDFLVGIKDNSRNEKETTFISYWNEEVVFFDTDFSNGKDFNLSFYDITGKLVLSTQINSTKTIISSLLFSKGFYTCIYTKDKTAVFNSKLIIQY